MSKLFFKMLRSLIIPKTDFVFKSANDLNIGLDEKKFDLYIHIPFCKNRCYFCPYNTMKYDQNLVPKLFNSLRTEVNIIMKKQPEILFNSVYIGGGTPTLVLDELVDFLDWLKARATILGEVAIETNPDDIDEIKFLKLREVGVNLVSIGVQSFNDKILNFLGRSYNSINLLQKISMVKKIGFEHVNIDLMWTPEIQSLDEFKQDLDMAIASETNQITAYPLFKFPHSNAGFKANLKKVKMPLLRKRRKFYKFFHEKLLQEDFRRVSVWGFSRNSRLKYSSVTRPKHLGIGPGAASRLNSGFFFNTFNFESYCDRIKSGMAPTSLHLEMTENLHKIYDVYWKYYETSVPTQYLDNIDNRLFKMIIKTLNIIGMQKKIADDYVLTEKGAFWVHLLQNYYILSYIENVWSISMQQPFPEEIRL